MTLASTLDYARLLRIFNIAVQNASYVLVRASLEQLEFGVLVHMQVQFVLVWTTYNANAIL